MKNIKKFYKEHRVFTILMAVVIVCLILLATLLIQCFYTGGKDKYGNRLEDIEQYEIKDSRMVEIEKKMSDKEDVEKVDIFITGRIIYCDIKFKGEIELLEAKNIAIYILDEFSTEEKAYYDFHFDLVKKATKTSEGFQIQGTRTRNGSGLSWNLNREVEKTETEE